MPPEGEMRAVGMNFRRGFFRLWLVVSALFILAVGFFAYEKVSGEFAKASQDWSSAGILLLPVDCREARGNSGTDYTPPDSPWNSYTAVARCWYKVGDFRRLYPEYKDLSDDAVSTKM